MIHRMDPAEGEPDPYPDPLLPMLANESVLPSSTRGWAAELAWGGVRAIARCRPGRLDLRDADLADIGARWPEVHRLSRQIGAHDAVLDGELVVFDEAGRPDRERLARRDKGGSDSAIRRRAKENPATYVIFDLLFLDGEDLTDTPYKRRRELLAGLELEGEAWRVPANATTKIKELLAAAAGQGVDGLVVKKQSSLYAPGRRTGEWLHVRADDEPDAEARSGSGAEPAAPASPPRPSRSTEKKARLLVGDRELTVSNLTKVLYPAVGFTKGELIDAYADLAEVLLPHLRGRPVTLKRYPDGVEGKFFYEKRSPETPSRLGGDGADLVREPQGRDRLHADRRPAEPGLVGEPGEHRAAHLALPASTTSTAPTRSSSTSTRAPPPTSSTAPASPCACAPSSPSSASTATRRPPARRASTSTCR